MRTRLLAALAALVLAIAGSVLISAYVRGADQRAVAGAETVDVLVITKPVAAGTPAEQLPDYVDVKAIPKSVVAADTLSTLGGAGGQVSAIDLLPGEQLLASRLVDPDDLVPSGTVEVPEGLQEVTIQLGPDRMVGGRIQAGDTVGIYASLAPDGTEPAKTHVLFHDVLVTSIQGAPTIDPAATTTAASAPPVPGAAMLVTFARSAAQVEKVVFAAEFGSIWLSKEPAGADKSDARIITRADLFQ